MNISKIITDNVLYIFIFILILSSLIYNYFYFFALDIDFNIVPISMIDYINNMQWEWIVPFLIYFVYIEFPLRRIEDFQTEDEIINRSTNPNFVKKIRSSPKKLFCFLSIIGIGTYTITYTIKKIYNLNINIQLEIDIFLLLATFCLLDWIIQSKNIPKALSVIALIFLYLGVIAEEGYRNGKNILNKNFEEILILKNNDNIHCAVLRNFNDYLLVKKSGGLAFISKSDIKTIELLK